MNRKNITRKFIPAKIIRKTNNNKEFTVKTIDRNVFINREIRQITNVRIEPGVFSPKRYVTTCYIKCYMQPFWYSETMVLSIGSSKKRHEEYVMFKNKMMPAQWSETMTTQIGKPQLHFVNFLIPMENFGIHYISLEPQQIAAKIKNEEEEEVTAI